MVKRREVENPESEEDIDQLQENSEQDDHSYSQDDGDSDLEVAA
jgi:hypothetical protein